MNRRYPAGAAEISEVSPTCGSVEVMGYGRLAVNRRDAVGR
jgi:hypothetical protein